MNQKLRSALAEERKAGFAAIVKLQADKAALRARVARLEVCARTYLLALELYLPSAVGVLGESDLAGALRSAEKDLRRALEEK